MILHGDPSRAHQNVISSMHNMLRPNDLKLTFSRDDSQSWHHDASNIQVVLNYDTWTYWIKHQKEKEKKKLNIILPHQIKSYYILFFLS